MQSSKDSSRDAKTNPALEHVTDAHQLLTALQEKIGEHPELAEAILKLENALSFLTANTGGLL